MNAEIQGTGGDCMKIALIKLDNWFKEKAIELNIPTDELGWPALSVYDQALVQLNDKYLDLAPNVSKLMAESINVFLHHLNGKADLEIKKHW